MSTNGAISAASLFRNNQGRTERRRFSTMFPYAKPYLRISRDLSRFNREHIVCRSMFELLLERPCAILRQLLSLIEPISRYSVLRRIMSGIFSEDRLLLLPGVNYR